MFEKVAWWQKDIPKETPTKTGSSAWRVGGQGYYHSGMKPPEITIEIPRQVVALYAKGLELASVRGVPAAHVRVYEYALDLCEATAEGTVQYQFTGDGWVIASLTPRENRHQFRQFHEGVVIGRIGAWVEFASLDEAKEFGFKRQATKLCGSLPNDQVFGPEWIKLLVWNPKKNKWVHKDSV